MIFIQLIIAAMMILFGAFFSGSETGVYSLSRLKVRLGAEQNRTVYRMLDEVIRDSHGLVLSILIGNKLVNYISTSIITLMIYNIMNDENTAQFYAAAVMTPVLFVFSEVIPKNLYYYRADSLMPLFAPLLWFFDRFFKKLGIVSILKHIFMLFNQLVGGGPGAQEAIVTGGRDQVARIFAESRDEGVLSPIQNEIVWRMLNIPRMNLASVMTPASKAVMVGVNTDRSEIKRLLEQYNYTRLPVYETNRSAVIGYVNLFEALISGGDFENIRQFVRPVTRLAYTTSILNAINIMKNNDDEITIVTSVSGQRRRVLGLVTMKDLAEELVGELAQW